MKIFLAWATRQQEETSTVNQLKSEYISTQEEKYYGMDEEINFLHEDELEDHKLTKHMKIFCKGISKTADIKPYSTCGHQWRVHWQKPYGTVRF